MSRSKPAFVDQLSTTNYLLRPATTSPAPVKAEDRHQEANRPQCSRRLARGADAARAAGGLAITGLGGRRSSSRTGIAAVRRPAADTAVTATCAAALCTAAARCSACGRGATCARCTACADCRPTCCADCECQHASGVCRHVNGARRSPDATGGKSWQTASNTYRSQHQARCDCQLVL